jgi:hypothetical protein
MSKFSQPKSSDTTLVAKGEALSDRDVGAKGRRTEQKKKAAISIRDRD